MSVTEAEKVGGSFVSGRKEFDWMILSRLVPCPSTEGLKEYFCKYGEVKECMVMRDPVTKRSR